MFGREKQNEQKTTFRLKFASEQLGDAGRGVRLPPPTGDPHAFANLKKTR
jgi:hypothetical protein